MIIGSPSTYSGGALEKAGNRVRIDDGSANRCDIRVVDLFRTSVGFKGDIALRKETAECPVCLFESRSFLLAIVVNSGEVLNPPLEKHLLMVCHSL